MHKHMIKQTQMQPYWCFALKIQIFFNKSNFQLKLTNSQSKKSFMFQNPLGFPLEQIFIISYAVYQYVLIQQV